MNLDELCPRLKWVYLAYVVHVSYIKYISTHGSQICHEGLMVHCVPHKDVLIGHIFDEGVRPCEWIVVRPESIAREKSIKLEKSLYNFWCMKTQWKDCIYWSLFMFLLLLSHELSPPLHLCWQVTSMYQPNEYHS